MLQSLAPQTMMILQIPSSSQSQSQMRSPSQMNTNSMMRCRAAAVQSFAEPATLISSRKPASFYEVLRVKKNASPVEIKAAYRSLAKLYHPDSSSESEDGRHFIEIHNAYETLSDPTARALYDLSLGLRRSSSPSSSSFGSGRRPTRRWETDQCW